MKTASSLLIQAAEHLCIIWESGICNSVYKVRKKNRFSERTYQKAMRYVRNFEPEDAKYRLFWGRDFSDNFNERQERRVLALCFAAAMAEYDGQ